MRRILIIVILVLCLAAAGLNLYYYFAQNKDPLDFYLETEKKNIELQINKLKNAYDIFYENSLPFLSGRYSTQMEVWGNAGYKNSTGIYEGISILNNFKLRINSKRDLESKNTTNLITLLIGNTPLLDINAFTDHQTLWFSIPVIMPETWFTLSNKHIGDLYKNITDRYGIEFIKPLQIISRQGLVQNFSFSEADLDKLSSEYGVFFKSFLQRKNVKYGDTSVVNIMDEDVKVKEVIISLSGEEFTSLVSQLLDKLATDETFINVVYNNWSSILSYLDDTGILQILRFSDNEYYNKIINTIDNLEWFTNFLDKPDRVFSFRDGVTMKVLIDKAENIINRTISIPFIHQDTSAGVVTLHSEKNNVKDLKNSFLELKFEGQNTYTIGMSSEAKGPTEGERSISLWYLDDDIKINGDFIISEAMDELTLTESRVVAYEISVTDTKLNANDKLDGQIEVQCQDNDKFKTRTINTRIESSVNMPTFNLTDMDFKININKTNTFNIDVFTPHDLTGKETISLDDLSDEDLSRLERRILASFGMFYLKNKELVDKIMNLPVQ